MPTIGQVVKELRTERGLSQNDLSVQSDGEINRNWLAALESDRIAEPPSAKMEALARHLGTSVTNIYDRAGIIDIPLKLPPEKQALLDAYDRLPAPLQRIALKLIRDLNAADSVQEGKPSEDAPSVPAKKSATG